MTSKVIQSQIDDILIRKITFSSIFFFSNLNVSKLEMNANVIKIQFYFKLIINQRFGH